MNILSRLFGKILQFLPRQINIEDGNYIEQLHGNYIQIIDENFLKRNKTEKILLNYVRQEIVSRLKQSLHSHISIHIDIEETPNQVDTPWSIDVKIGSNKPFLLPPETTIIDIYDREDINGRLLILGEPGSGKTTTVLQLAQVLAERAYKDVEQPIPILLNLSAWKDDKQNIKDWIVSSLESAPYKIRKDIARKWLESRVVIPLLDGLDELASDRQEKCVQQINQFITSDGWLNPLVVCSRTEEYQHYQTLLALSGSIILRSLSDEQIRHYIEQSEGEELWSNIKDDSQFIELAKTPLLLNLIVISYDELSFDDWRNVSSSQQRLTYLFNSYILKMLKRKYRGKKPNNDKVKQWLKWLGQHLIVETETEFYIENIQPNCLLPKGQYSLGKDDTLPYEIIYRIIIGLVCGLFISPIFGVVAFALSNSFIFGIFAAIIANIFIGIIIGLAYKLIDWKIYSINMINPRENLEFSFFAFKNKLPENLEEGLSKGWEYGINYGVIFGSIFGIIPGLSFAGMMIFLSTNNSFEAILYFLFVGIVLAVLGGFLGALLGALTGGIHGLFAGVVYSLINAFSTKDIEIKRHPNQGIKKSFKNGILLSIVLFFIIVIVSFTIQGTLWILNLYQYYNFIDGFLETAIITSTILSNLPIIQHFSLRVILWLKGYAPWNYARFLNYATDRLFLQRVGGGYRFIHRSLQEHFAEM